MNINKQHCAIGQYFIIRKMLMKIYGLISTDGKAKADRHENPSRSR